MTQNIYDDEEFFQGYSRLRRSVEGLDGAPEWPALRALLPNLSGLAVLDLGCGFGWFCRWARQQGAAYVLGIDISEKMLARGRAATVDQEITPTPGPTWSGSTCRQARSTWSTVRSPSTMSTT